MGFPANRSDVTFSAPALVIEHVTFDTCAAQFIAQVHVAPSYPQFAAVLMNPQFSTTCVEVPTPKVTSSSQAHQEHLVVEIRHKTLWSSILCRNR